jgi:diguanylate cyclase (GGDEF)-like protein/PAS domain S-box-containing protein
MASPGAPPRPARRRASSFVVPALVLAAGLAVTAGLARWRSSTDAGGLQGLAAGRSSTSTAVLVGGALVSVLLALLVLVLAGQRRRLRQSVRVALGESVELRRRFQSAFDDAPIGVLMLALDGTVLRATRALREMLRRTSGPIDLPGVIHPDDLSKARDAMQALASGRSERLELEVRFVRRRPEPGDVNDDGRTVVWANVSAAAVCGADGAVDYIVAHLVDRTDRREEAERLHMAEVRFRTAFDHATTGIALVSPEGRYLEVNSALCRILDRSEDELLGMGFVDVRHPGDLRASTDVRERLLRGDLDADTVELRFLRPSGEVVWGRTSISAVRDAEDRVLYFLSLTEDITAERHAEEELSRRRRWFEAIVEHATDVVCLLDPVGIIRWVSPSAERVLGYGPDKIGTSMVEVLHPADRGRVLEAFHEAVNDPTPGSPIEFRIAHADGTWRHFETVATNLLHDPDVAGIVANSRDVTERVEAAEQLSHRASHDPLTGLANRELLLERMAAALDDARRSGSSVGALYLDIDSFKVINDRYGHAAGDRVLQGIAAQLLRTVRPGDTVARLGGDEFVVLAEGVNGSADCLLLAERLRVAATEPVVLPTGDRVGSAISAGVSVASGPTVPDALLREADAALYRAKERGRDRCELFDASLRAAGVRRLGTELLLHQALDQGELVLHYQPVFELATGAVVAAEALLRLERATGDLVVPSEFLEVAEETGLIVTIGAGVFDGAYKQMAAWRIALGAKAPTRMCVNVSSRQLAHPGFVGHITRAIGTSGVGPEMVGLELAESTLRDASPASLDALQELRKLGILVAIDGFGNALTSLTAIQWLPADIVKIDRALVAGLRGSPAPAAVATVRAVLDVARSCGLATVAVGVEDESELAVLRELGCTMAQGFLFGAPVPAVVLEHELASPRPLWAGLVSPS